MAGTRQKTYKGKDELKCEGEEVDRPPYPLHREHVLCEFALCKPGPKLGGMCCRVGIV